ncbi:MAG: VOC family protein [Pseudomonadota bacterium]
MRVELDHIVVSGETLAEAVACVEEALGVEMQPGGAHTEMGTHNRVLSLGPGLYLEAISIDPDATAPNHARWYALDRFRGKARTTNWALRTDDLSAACDAAPDGIGAAMSFRRNGYVWDMAVPEDGILPYDGACPAVMQWTGDQHPSKSLPDCGCRLERLEIQHPRAVEMMTAFPELLRLPKVRIGPGPRPQVRAEIITPHGLRYLRG